MRYSIALAIFLSSVDAFSPNWVASPFSSSIGAPSHQSSDQLTTLFAKKKKGNANANAKVAALEALEALEGKVDLDEPISKKEQKNLEKQKNKNATKKNAKEAAVEALDAFETEDIDAPLSLKEQKALAKKQMKAEKM